MKILIDILHPAHVHFFRNFYNEMIQNGHDILITARDKECTIDLLRKYNIPFTRISRQKTGKFGMAIELITRTARMIGIIAKFRPDVLTGIMGPSIALAGKFCRVPSVVFYDTEIATHTNRFVYPLSHSVCTPDCYLGNVKGHHIRYPGFQELAYLHPRRFTPDPDKLSLFGLSPDEPYIVLRFVSWQASHDIGQSGISLENKYRLVELASQYGKVIISSEGNLPDDLEQYRSKGPVADIHHLLAFAQLIIGDSGTMSTEAACLGVPGVVFMPFELGNFVELEKKYGILKQFQPGEFDSAARVINDLLSSSPRESGAIANKRLLEDKIDVTDWMISFFKTSFG